MTVLGPGEDPDLGLVQTPGGEVPVTRVEWRPELPDEAWEPGALVVVGRDTWYCDGLRWRKASAHPAP